MTRVRSFHAVLCAAALLALTLILAPAGLCAPVEATFTASSEAVFIEDDPFAGVDLAAGYIASRMPGTDDDLPLLTPRNLGEDLGGLEKRIYDWMRPEIIKVAKGERASTEFLIPVEDVLDKLSYTAADAGVDSLYDYESGEWNQAAIDFIFAQQTYDFKAVVKALRHDLPYEMYWFDPTKTGGYSVAPSGLDVDYDDDDELILIVNGSLSFYLCVSRDYAAENSFAYNETFKKDVSFTMDTSLGQAVTAAADNAQAIVTQYANASDLDKLTGYKDTICDRTSYNHEAADDDDTPYGDPWQLVWVFDGDADTQVVCEGYSKAFQYLCDLTDFDDDAITVITVTGDMVGATGAGRHMWNIAHMDDGENYLIDVTNCDSSSIGHPDLLFLKGHAPYSSVIIRTGTSSDGTVVEEEHEVDNSVAGGYVFDCDGAAVSFVYDDDLPFSPAELTLSATDYAGAVRPSVSIDETNFPDDFFRTWVLQNADLDNEGDEGYGELSYAEICAMTDMDVSGLAIADLTGLGYFSRLQSLDASDNHLTALDLSGFEDLAADDVDLSGQTIDDSVTVVYADGSYAADLSSLSLDLERTVLPDDADFDEATCTLIYDFLPDAITWYYDTGLEDVLMDVTCGVAYTPVVVAAIDEDHFPDAAFLAWVLEYVDDGNAVLSDAEAAAVTDMDVSGLGIADLTGLEYFSRLQSLDASDNHLTALDLSGFEDLAADDVDLSGQTIPGAGSVSIELIGGRYVADVAPVVQCFDGLSGIEFVGAVLDPETNKATYTRLPEAVTVQRGTGLAGAKLGIDFPVAYTAPDRYCGELDVPLDIQAAMHIGYIPEGDSYVVTVFGPNAYDGTDPIYEGANGVIRFTPKQPGLTTFGIRANGSGEADTVNVRVFATGAGAFRLPDGMTAIGGSAFADDESIEEVLIPNGQTAIGANAFAGCAGLRLVWMPEDVAAIDDAAFGSFDANGKPTECPDLTFCCPNGGTAAAWADAHKVPHFFLDPES